MGSNVPAQHVEAEREVLGLLLVNNAAWDVVGKYLRREHFYVYYHKTIYSTIERLIGADQQADVMALYEEGCHLEEYLNGLVTGLRSDQAPNSCVALLLERWIQAEATHIGFELQDGMFSGCSSKEVLKQFGVAIASLKKLKAYRSALSSLKS